MGTDPSITIFLVAASSLKKNTKDYITRLDELKHYFRIYAGFFWEYQTFGMEWIFFNKIMYLA